MVTFSRIVTFGECAVHAPFTFQPSFGTVIGKVQFSTPIGKRLSAIIPSQIMIGDGMIGLNKFNSPFHIAFFVMSIVVNAMHRMLFGGSVAKFCVKLFKRLKTKLNPASAIAMEQFEISVMTSRFSGAESSIFRGHAVIGSSPMSCAGFSSSFFTNTSARNLLSRCQITRSHSASIATRTDAMPMRTPFDITRISNDQQLSKGLSGQDAKLIRMLVRVFANVKLVNRHEFFSFIEKFRLRVVESFRFLQPAFVIIP